MTQTRVELFVLEFHFITQGILCEQLRAFNEGFYKLENSLLQAWAFDLSGNISFPFASIGMGSFQALNVPSESHPEVIS